MAVVKTISNSQIFIPLLFFLFVTACQEKVVSTTVESPASATTVAVTVTASMPRIEPTPSQQVMMAQTPRPTHTPVPAQTPTASSTTPSPTPVSSPVPTPTTVLVTPVATGLIPSSMSTDSILLLRDDGAFVWYDLANHEELVLLNPGLYNYVDVISVIPLRLSPDGQWLLIPTPKNGTWLVSMDGQAQQQINPEPLSATWAPDSRRITFSYYVTQPSPDVYVQDVVAGALPRLVASLPGQVFSPTWSPKCASGASGNCAGLIAVVANAPGSNNSEKSAWLINAESGQTKLLGNFEPAFHEGDLYLRWSPDGREVEVPAAPEIMIFPVEGGKPRPLPDTCRPPCRHLRFYEALSPDGTLLAGIYEADDGLSSLLTITQMASGRQVQFKLPLTRVISVIWTDDGRQILANTIVCDENQKCRHPLWAIDPALGRPVLIAEEHLLWSTLSELVQSSTEISE